MTIVKDIYVHSHSFSDVIEMHAYLADSLKTDGGKYVRGLGFITENYLDELYAVKVANQQTHTTQFRQITVSISSANNTCSDEELMKIGVDMAKHIYLKGFQVVVYLHKDTKNPHLHFLANAVNFKNGKIFKQTKKELNRLKVHCNHILNDHSLDQIQMSPEDMLDTTSHYLSDGFDAFEIFDEIMTDKSRIFEDLHDEAQSTQHDSYHTYDYGSRISFSFPALLGYDSNNTFEHPATHELNTAHQEVNTMENKEDNKALSTPSTSQLPEQILDNNGLMLDCSKNITFRVPSDCDKSQLADLINNVAPVSEHERVHNTKMGIGALAELKKRGYDMPVYVDNSTNINITFDDVLDSNIIDLPFTEE